jgi:hypothetical protein
VQSNALIEGVWHKIRRQIEDLEGEEGAGSGTLAVDGVPIETYLSRSVQRLVFACVRVCLLIIS